MKKNNIYLKRAIIFVLAIILSYSSTTLYILPYKNASRAVSYYYGSKGKIITDTQTKLKAWGYYTGSVDGVYGYNTYKAVRKFQSKNKLKVDGVIGDRTLAALGINVGSKTSSSSKKYTNNQDVMLLARLINGEARGEPYEGQVAVGAVVLNRTRNSKFPNTVAGVIYQPGAFTAIVDGQINAQIKQSSINAARDALNGWDPSGGAIYYFNPDKATSAWIWSRPLIKIIGKHRFCN
ncbi:spore cortex-lytic enzyme [Clostridium oceanicum]|uniref:Spore cortex-lytic enzyme n=1 Tax=Clostridium oceanicum TaxID=1543 RepID=A0ABN1JQ95_9CLOT